MRPDAAPLRSSRDRWLISYVDLVTILLACFATTYAAAPARPAVPAVRHEEHPPATLTPPATSPPAGATVSVRDLVTPIVTANARQRIAFADTPNSGEVVIALPESASFATGSAVLAGPARQFLRALAASLRGVPVSVRIEGHTDTIPVAGGRYSSNWELSTARASAVVGFLIEDGLFAPEALSAAGYGEFHPRVDNDTAEHRAVNRRVDVVLIARAP